jgi:ring-1,2-phenylacetyl-CoA epoxidase subunit PaaE
VFQEFKNAMSALRFQELAVKRVSPEAAGAVAITLAIPEAERERFAFEPGQFLTLRATINGQDVRRNYSISSPRSRLAKVGELEVGIRPVEGGVFSNWAATSVKAGDTLQVMPPDGRFTVRKKRAIHRVGFAAGSGITPILSIAASTLEEQARESKFTLVYGNRRMSSVMFNEALQDLKDRYRDRLTLIHILSRQAQEVDLLQGRIDGDKVREIIRALLPVGSMDEVFICGPDEMIMRHGNRPGGGRCARRPCSYRALYRRPARRCQAGGRCTAAASAAAAAKDIALTVILDGKEHEDRHRCRRACARRGPQCRPRPALLLQGRRVLHLPRQGAGRLRGDGQELHPGGPGGESGLRAELPGPRHQQAPVGELSTSAEGAS